MFSHHRPQAHPRILDTTKPSSKVFSPLKKHRAHSDSEYTITEENHSECSFQSTEFQDPYQSACDFKAINEVSRVLGEWLETTRPIEGKTLHVTPTDEGILLQETVDEDNLISEAYSVGYSHAVEDLEAHLEEQASFEEEVEAADPYLQGYNDALEDVQLDEQEQEDTILYNQGYSDSLEDVEVQNQEDEAIHIYDQGYSDALEDVELQLEEKDENTDPYLEGYNDALEDVQLDLQAEEDASLYNQGYSDALEDVEIEHELEKAEIIDPYLEGYNNALEDVQLDLKEEEDVNLYDQGYNDALDDVKLELEEKAEDTDPYLKGYSDALEELMAELSLDNSETESITSQDSLPSLVSFSAQSADTVIPGGFEIDNDTETAASDVDYDDFSSLACECEECLGDYENDSELSETGSGITVGEFQDPEMAQSLPTPTKSTLEHKYELKFTDAGTDEVVEEYLSEVARAIEAHLPPAEGDMLRAYPSDVQDHIRKATGNMEKHVEEFGIPYLHPLAAFTMEWRLVIWKEALANGLQMSREDFLATSKHYEMTERILKNDPKLTVKEIEKFQHNYVLGACGLQEATKVFKAGFHSVGDEKTEVVFEGEVASGEHTCTACGCGRSVMV